MLNTAQNKKLLVKLTRALETYEPYVFTEICTLPFSMYETSERLTDVPEAALFQDPVQRPQGRIWGGEGRYRPANEVSVVTAVVGQLTSVICVRYSLGAK